MTFFKLEPVSVNVQYNCFLVFVCVHTLKFHQPLLLDHFHQLCPCAPDWCLSKASGQSHKKQRTHLLSSWPHFQCLTRHVFHIWICTRSTRLGCIPGLGGKEKKEKKRPQTDTKKMSATGTNNLTPPHQALTLTFHWHQWRATVSSHFATLQSVH